MAFVLDASIAGCWAFDDEDHPVAAKALDLMRTDQAIVPHLWWLEVRNLLIMNERRGRGSEAVTADFLRSLSHLPIAVDGAAEDTRLPDLARRHRLTVYDAAYLELAQRLDAPLATLDEPLARAAKAERVVLIGASG